VRYHEHDHTSLTAGMHLSSRTRVRDSSWLTPSEAFAHMSRGETERLLMTHSTLLMYSALEPLPAVSVQP